MLQRQLSYGCAQTESGLRHDNVHNSKKEAFNITVKV